MKERKKERQEQIKKKERQKETTKPGRKKELRKETKKIINTPGVGLSPHRSALQERDTE
jgi:hypothetical protein